MLCRNCAEKERPTSRRGFGLLAPWQKAPGRRIGVRGAELRDLVPSASAREGAKSEFSGTRFSIFGYPKNGKNNGIRHFAQYIISIDLGLSRGISSKPMDNMYCVCVYPTGKMAKSDIRFPIF